LEDEVLISDDLAGERFGTDHTGQLSRWRDRLSERTREHYNKYGKSSVEIALKEEPQGEEIVPALGLENKSEENYSTPANVVESVNFEERLAQGTLLRISALLPDEQAKSGR